MSESPETTAAALSRLTDVSRALTYAASLDEVLDITVECALDLLAARRAVLMLQDEDDLLRVRASRGVPDELVEQFHEPLDETLVSRLEAVFGPGAREGFLGVPLVVRGAVIGLLAVLRGPERPPSPRDEWLLSALADQASVALDNARRGDRGSALEARGQDLGQTTFRRDDALRMITHDLRSPLSALHGYLHLLDEGLYGPLTEPQRAALARLQAVSRHLQGLVADVVEVGRLATGTLTLDCGPVDVAEVAAEAVAMVELDARDHGVRIVVDAPPGVRVQGEPDRLRQVLVHLLENAVRYAPEESDITLRVTPAGREGEAVQLRVIDTGPGIPEDQVEEIFQPYHRLAAGTRGSGGLGLGLALARALVELMDGTIGVDPEADDCTAFLVRLRPA